MRTNKTPDLQRDEALERAISQAGGAAALVRFLNAYPGQEPIKIQAIASWRRCPPRRVLAVEAACRGEVRRHELRPDLYPEAPPSS